ncbi:MAG: hypothetical protein JWO03_3466, partial [Bacteroidetes bacterium]|nr:hypothetical protein [Bacteroidota bacterium]
MKSMKKQLLFLLGVVITLTAMSQDQKAAEAFNAKAKQIDSIFAKPIIVPASQKFSTAPTGRVYYRYKIEKLNS